MRPGYDVICLQEVFDEEAREVFDNGLKRRFPHRVAKVHDGDIFNEDSGLFFASRYPIKAAGKATRYEEFQDTGGPFTADFWADKGLFGARLDLTALSPGLTLCVFSTHLQSDYHEGEYEEVRRSQIQQIRHAISRALLRVHRPDNTVVLLMGDFNVVGEFMERDLLHPTQEYRRMLTLLGYARDLFREKCPNDPGYTWDARENTNMIPPGDGDRQRLDYVLTFNAIPPLDPIPTPVGLRVLYCTQAMVQTFGRTRDTHLSDHFAVDVTVTLTDPPQV
jgi:endonuclease/exonuclease/phosphatase family metal-dependent hydrolase